MLKCTCVLLLGNLFQVQYFFPSQHILKATSQSRIGMGDTHVHSRTPDFYSMYLPMIITRWHPSISKEIFSWRFWNL